MAEEIFKLKKKNDKNDVEPFANVQASDKIFQAKNL